MWSKFTPMSYVRLPLTVAHHPMEPATSFISRLAARNGVRSVLEFCRDIRFPYSALVAGDPDAIKLLAQLGGCDFEALMHASISNVGGNAFRLRDEMATSQSLQRSRIRVCPKCVQADVGLTQDIWRAWRRISWQFTSVRSCTTHQCALVSLPAEKFTLRGYDFAAQLRLHWQEICRAAPKPCAPSAFENWLMARIGGLCGQGWIDSLELNVATRACEILGLRLVEGPQTALSGHDATGWARYADAGYEVLRGGDRAFEVALSDMLKGKDIDRRFFSKVYGPLTTWLNGRSLGDEFEPLRTVVRAYIFGNFAVRRGVLVLGRASVGKIGNIQSVAALGLPKRLTDLMLQRGLANLDADGNVVPEGFVTETMISALKREPSYRRSSIDQQAAQHGGRDCASLGMLARNNVMTVRGVVQRLKVTKPTVLYLCKNGLLEQLQSPCCQRDGSVAISAKSVERFAKTYVSLGRFAAKRECRQGALAIKLKNADVPMLAMPPKFSRIYRQTDLNAFIS